MLREYPSCPFLSLWAVAPGRYGELVARGQKILGALRRNNSPTPPCDMTTSPRSLPNLKTRLVNRRHRFQSQHTPHHFEWQVANAEAQYGASCYHGRRYRRVRGFQQQDTRGLQQGILEGGVRRGSGRTEPQLANLEHQHPRAEHSFPSSTDDVYDRRGIGDQLLLSEIGTCRSRRHLQPCRTLIFR